MNIIIKLEKVEINSRTKAKDNFQRGKNQNIQETIREFLKSYKNDPSILQMKNIYSSLFHVKKKLCFHFVNEKKRIVRVNKALFMTKEFQKVIYISLIEKRK